MAVYPELRGRVALVTGAAQGIGAAIVRAFGAQGCNVALIDLQDVESMKPLVSEIEKAGTRARAFPCDVRDARQVTDTVIAVRDALGPVDVLINNAGICRDAVIWKMDDAAWHDVIETNLSGFFHFIRAVAPSFRERKSGRIVNVASINALRGKFGQSNYAASKAGIIGLTKSVARELGPSGVNVNAIAPGLTETEMTASMPDEARARSLAEIVLGRVATPDDIARVVVFLCSDDARHVTGAVIPVDGGQSM